MLFVALAAATVLYGALLRLDALTMIRGAVERPAWLSALQRTRTPDSSLRPASVTWPPAAAPYISDPATYLQYAREMRSFYAAHRREPVFPFATRVWLWLLDNQDVAVSFASACFSVLAIAATYLLGAAAFSRVVGLGAAFLLAIEYDVITWGVDGGRDDAFMCSVIVFAYAMLRCVRNGARWNWVLLGAVGAVACLIRITALSFVGPGLLYLLFAVRGAWQERVQRVALSSLVAFAIVAPFLINCWITYGDPLYAINVHADVYRAAEGQPIESNQTAAEYLGGMAARRPVQAVDTFVMGMTAYPFQNKWTGFDRWAPSLGRWLSWAAIAGVLVLAGSAVGRLLLFVLAASLLPYAMTWKLIFDWRFTEHAYPFLLLAVMVAIAAGATLPRAAISLARAGSVFAWRPALRWAVILVTAASGVLVVTRVLPVLVVRESLAAGEEVTIMAGGRDGSFFGDGWSRPQEQGIIVRVSHGDESEVWIPLPRVQDYHLAIRLDPFPLPTGEAPISLPRVHVFANGRTVSAFDLQWNPTRVGTYQVQLPAATLRVGFNRLTLRARTRDDALAGMRIW